MSTATTPSAVDLVIGSTVADFSLPATGNQTFHLAAQRGQPLVIYFYPKDSTPGCTTEAQQFSALYTDFVKAGGNIWGISRDSLKSHENFKTKLALPFALLCDSEETLCCQFDVIKLKNLYGKQVKGIERSTFLIDSAGRLAREWRGVKAEGHAAEVLAALQAL